MGRKVKTHFFIMEQALLLEQTKTLILSLLSAENIELVDLCIAKERNRLCLRLLVDKQPSGITLDECARLNARLSQIFDEANIIPESYILEVASPGLDRPLKTTPDFQRCLGKIVKVVLHSPLQRQNVWLGRLEEVTDENIVIRTNQEKSLCLSRDNIAWVRQEVQI